MFEEKIKEESFKKIEREIRTISDLSFHRGRRGCRQKYKDSGFLVLNPKIDWDKEMTNPCEKCSQKGKNGANRLLNLKMECLSAPSCPKFQRYLLALEIKEHFKFETDPKISYEDELVGPDFEKKIKETFNNI